MLKINPHRARIPRQSAENLNLFNKFLIMFFIVLFLTGCEKKLTYLYLMTHPNVLKQKIADCQSTDEKSTKEIKECKIVYYAASNMFALINEQQEDPEKFGLRIMNLEIAFMKTKEQLHLARQQLSSLQNKKATKEELQTAQDALNRAKRSYHDMRDELRILLSVVGMNSPG